MEVSTTKQAVERLLRPRRWISGLELEIEAGPSALRRLRELRGQGYEIKKRKGEQGYEYRLVARP